MDSPIILRIRLEGTPDWWMSTCWLVVTAAWCFGGLHWPWYFVWVPWIIWAARGFLHAWREVEVTKHAVDARMREILESTPHES